MKTANNWEWAVNWLKSKMVDSFGNTSNYVSWNTKPQSNDDSETRTFQRTKSAQVNVNLMVIIEEFIIIIFYLSVLWMTQQHYFQNQMN